MIRIINEHSIPRPEKFLLEILVLAELVRQDDLHHCEFYSFPVRADFRVEAMRFRTDVARSRSTIANMFSYIRLMRKLERLEKMFAGGVTLAVVMNGMRGVVCKPMVAFVRMVERNAVPGRICRVSGTHLSRTELERRESTLGGGDQSKIRLLWLS